MNFKVGQNIQAKFLNGNYQVKGTIIKIIKPYEPLTELEIKEYAKIDKNHNDYQSVQGKHCKVFRLILETQGSYAIVPVRVGVWEYNLLDHHPENPEKKIFIGVDYAKVEEALLIKESDKLFEDFDPYTIVANKHSLERNLVKTVSFKGFYSKGTAGKRELLARRELIIAQIEDSLERGGII